jgi:hypothetical protein
MLKTVNEWMGRKINACINERTGKSFQGALRKLFM